MKSKEESSDLVRAHASKPYSKLGMHLLFINCKITSSFVQFIQNDLYCDRIIPYHISLSVYRNGD